MKKFRTILSVVLLAIVILIAIAAAAIGLFANKALANVIESSGTKALSVAVKVGKVDLSILQSKLDLRNLTIDNPPGYRHERLLELGEGRINVETKSLLGDVVNIRDIKLDNIGVVLEQRGVSGNNLQDIINKLPAKKEQTGKPAGKKLHIDTLELTNVTVNVNLLPIPGKVDTLTLKLSPIKMTDLGGDNDLDTAALSRTVLLAIAGGIVEQGSGVLPDEMLGSLTSQLEQLGALPGSLIKAGKKLLDAGVGAEKGAEEAGKQVLEGLQGLLKRKEDKE